MRARAGLRILLEDLNRRLDLLERLVDLLEERLSDEGKGSKACNHGQACDLLTPPQTPPRS